MLNLDWLDAFVVFSEHLNFTRAARALHLSQPALHGQIARLSEALGVPLYRRRGRHLELTEDGLRVARFGREMRERTARFLDVMRTGASRQPVVLCAGEGSYLYLLGDAVRAFAASGAAPLRLLTRDRDGTLDAVRAGEAHLGVAPLDDFPDDRPHDLLGGLACTPLAAVPHVVALPADHPLARRRALALRDLAGARLVVPSLPRPHRVALAKRLADAGVAWEVAVEANGWPLILHFVALGVGLAVVNGFCRMPDGVVARPLRGVAPTRYHVVRRDDAEEPAAVAQLRALIERHARGAAGDGGPRGRLVR